MHFVSDIPNPATDHHLDAYDIPLDSDLTCGAQTFGYDLAMYPTNDGDLLIPENYDVSKWDVGHIAPVHGNAGQFEKYVILGLHVD